jgi:hypothetical protein
MKWVIDGGWFWRILFHLSPGTKPFFGARVSAGYPLLRVAAFSAGQLILFHADNSRIKDDVWRARAV